MCYLFLFSVFPFLCCDKLRQCTMFTVSGHRFPGEDERHKTKRKQQHPGRKQWVTSVYCWSKITNLYNPQEFELNLNWLFIFFLVEIPDNYLLSARTEIPWFDLCLDFCQNTESGRVLVSVLVIMIIIVHANDQSPIKLTHWKACNYSHWNQMPYGWTAYIWPYYQGVTTSWPKIRRSYQLTNCTKSHKRIWTIKTFIGCVEWLNVCSAGEETGWKDRKVM